MWSVINASVILFLWETWTETKILTKISVLDTQWTMGLDKKMGYLKQLKVFFTLYVYFTMFIENNLALSKLQTA